MNPETVEDVIIDFEGRRSAILTALTNDFDKLHKQCDPTIQQSLCLYGSPDSHWMVKPPSPYFDLPDPKSGINLVRDDMDKHDWLSMVALHSDVWLNAIPFYYAAKLGFGKSDRLRLFEKIASFSSISKSVSIRSMNKERKRKLGALPEELLLEVLSRVPVRDLVRFRTVCKRWKRLIDDHAFVSTHLTNYKPNSEGFHLLVIQGTIPSDTIKKAMVCHPNTFRKVMDLENCLIDNHGCTKFRIWDYINGVMLIMKGVTHALDDIILWNPSINKSLDISNPTINNDLENDALIDIGLGIDASNNDLKVVAFIYPHIEHASHRRFHGIVPGYIQVYALSTKSWRSNASVCPPPYWSIEPQVFINGCIHWPSLGPELRDGDSWRNLRDSHIVSFDVSEEVINYFKLPSIAVKDETSLIVIDGLLGMLYSCGSHHQVWVMEEYGVQKSWSPRYKFEIQFDELLHFKSNGELIFALNHGGIRSYDIKRKSLNYLRQPSYSSIQYNIYTYVESLLLG